MGVNVPSSLASKVLQAVQIQVHLADCLEDLLKVLIYIACRISQQKREKEKKKRKEKKNFSLRQIHQKRTHASTFV